MFFAIIFNGRSVAINLATFALLSVGAKSIVLPALVAPAVVASNFNPVVISSSSSSSTSNWLPSIVESGSYGSSLVLPGKPAPDQPNQVHKSAVFEDSTELFLFLPAAQRHALRWLTSIIIISLGPFTPFTAFPPLLKTDRCSSFLFSSLQPVCSTRNALLFCKPFCLVPI